ncbi:MAG: topoisomerase, partial [Enterocloster sp.]
EYDMTADELLAGVEHTETKAEQAEKLILDLLSDGKQMLSADIDKAAARRGISARTVRTAKQSLGNKLISERSGTQWLLSLKTE